MVPGMSDIALFLFERIHYGDGSDGLEVHQRML
jgi:hypothetical protein